MIFTKEDFKTMPWKNGGGLTTELYRVPHQTNDSFLFRISAASVHSSGPFSLFPGIDRILLLLEGKGFHLKGEGLNAELNDKKTPLTFSGENPINCTLLEGPCKDFNVMTDRSYAKSTISVVETSKIEEISFKAECDFTFIYDKEDEKLYKLLKGESTLIKVLSSKILIVIDVTLL